MGEVWQGVSGYPNYEVSALGRVRNTSKGRGWFQILTAETVAEIRMRRAAGERGRVLAAVYGVSEQRICDIYKGRTTL